MMRAAQLEAWTLSVVERVERGQPLEDSRVELKAAWPDPGKATRQLAGHANAARGDDVLWIVGLDEKHGVQCIPPEELATWWPKVTSEFQSTAPVLTDLVVATEKGPVTALLIETSRSPYVVKNPTFGKPGGGSVALEVPWREGTQVRSARREDLLRLLVPALAVPEIEVLNAEVGINRSGHDAQEHYLWHAAVELYVIPRTAERVVIPFHRVTASIEVGELRLDALRPSLQPRKQSPPLRFVVTRRDSPPSPPRVLSHTVQGLISEVLIDGPGLVDFTLWGETAPIEIDSTTLRLTALLRPVFASREIVVALELDPAGDGTDGRLRWAWTGDR